MDCAKNAVLPILAAAMLTDAPVTIEDCPDLVDARNMLSILETLGCRVERRGREVLLDASRAENHEMPEQLSKRLRSSIFLLGPLIARFGRARVSYPGGCEIGQRPIDLHLKGLRALGVHHPRGARHDRVRGRAPARRGRVSGLSQRRGHGKRDDGRGAGAGANHHT